MAFELPARKERQDTECWGAQRVRHAERGRVSADRVGERECAGGRRRPERGTAGRSG